MPNINEVLLIKLKNEQHPLLRYIRFKIPGPCGAFKYACKDPPYGSQPSLEDGNKVHSTYPFIRGIYIVYYNIIIQRLVKDVSLGSLCEYLKDQFLSKLGLKKKRNSRSKHKSWKIQLFNHRTENAGRDQQEKPLNETYPVSDLIKGPLGDTDYVKLRKTKHKNVKISPNCERNLELMINFHFEDGKAFKIFKNLLYNKDFIGLETKKYFLQNFIENETSKAMKMFDSKIISRNFSPRELSNSFKRSVDKNEISNMIKQQFNVSNEEASCSQLFQLNDTNRLHSNQFIGESNLFLLGDSKKNSMGFFRGHDSQFMSILNGKDTPGDPSNLILDINRNINSFHKRSKDDNSNILQLTPVKGSDKKRKDDSRFNNKGFRDLKMNQIYLENGKIDKPLSNFIFHNENASKGFELTRKEMINKSQHLKKRENIYEDSDPNTGKNDTPVYDFKNVTKKIYGVDNLKKLKKTEKKKSKKEGKINENLELFLQESERISRKENNKDIIQKKNADNLSMLDKDNSNVGNYSNSVNTGKSTKKYDEGLLKLYSKV